MKHEANADKIETQLKAWGVQLDELVVGYLHAGALANDPYRVRIDGLRTRQEAVQAKLEAFNAPDGTGGPMTSFRASIAEDWSALETGFKDLSQTPSAAAQAATSHPRQVRLS